jgi:sugar lactone lactonase YvrE
MGFSGRVRPGAGTRRDEVQKHPRASATVSMTGVRLVCGFLLVMVAVSILRVPTAPSRSGSRDAGEFGGSLALAASAGFVPVVPVRVFDTRPGEPDGLVPVAKVQVGGERVLRVKVTGVGGVPVSGVGAVALNVTAVDPQGAGFVTVFPCGDRPLASNLNFTAGQTVPNSVIAPVSAAGEVCFYSNVNTHLLADVSGWFASAAGFSPVTPVRVFDTRPGEPDGVVPVPKAQVGGSSVLRVKVTGVGGVPASGVGAVALNVTAVGPQGAGFVTVFPCGDRPLASNLNFTAGQTVPNSVIAPVSALGEVCFYGNVNTYLLADVSGWFAASTGFSSVTPVRVFDTRPGEPDGVVVVPKAVVGGSSVLRVKVAGVGGVPSAGVGAVALNVTAVGPQGAGFVTVFPCGDRPLASNLNFTAGQTVPNSVIAPVSALGEVCFYGNVNTHLLADVSGWFAAGATSDDPTPPSTTAPSPSIPPPTTPSVTTPPATTPPPPSSSPAPSVGSLRTLAGSTMVSPSLGGFAGDGGPASEAVVSRPQAIAIDSSGRLLVADTGNDRVRVMSSGVVDTLVGGGALFTAASAGDVQLRAPSSVAGDGAGGVVFIDPDFAMVRRVSSSGVVSVVAGSGPTGALSGIGGPAVSATLRRPVGVAVDASGAVYVTDYLASMVFRIGADGVLTRIAGSGVYADSGDGGLAVNAGLKGPWGVAVDAAGNVYVADQDAGRVRKISPSGVISTIAGTGLSGFGGDGGPAVAAQLARPTGLAVGADGSVYVADTWNNRIRRITPAGTISTLAGSGSAGFSGDAGPAALATLDGPMGVALGPDGSVLVADSGNNRIRMINPAGVISTVIGQTLTADSGFAGDGGVSTAALLREPSLAVQVADGSTIVADTGNNRVRRISPAGVISTIAGSSEAGFSGDGGPAVSAQLSSPSGLAVDAAGAVFVADTGNNRVRRISPTGVISTIAGSSEAGFSGDGGPAVSAQLSSPSGLWIDPNGNLFVADTGNNRIRRISPAGTITTVAGNGIATIGGDGGPAVAASLNGPRAIAGDGSGNVYIADTGNHRVRKVSTGGIISTIAGNGIPMFAGDGGPAVEASLYAPSGIAVSADGVILIADSRNHRVRQLSESGTISTIAGTGTAGFGGDTGPATLASFNAPSGLSLTISGTLLVADSGNSRIRALTGTWRPVSPGAAAAAVGAASLFDVGRPAPADHLSTPQVLMTGLMAVAVMVVLVRLARRHSACIRRSSLAVDRPSIGSACANSARSRLRVAAWATVTVTIAANLIVPAVAPLPDAQAAPGPLKVLILGDSYSAGTGGGSYHDIGSDSWGCHRSKNTWGQKLKVRLSRQLGREVDVTNRACNGAVADQLLSQPQSVDPAPAHDNCPEPNQTVPGRCIFRALVPTSVEQDQAAIGRAEAYGRAECDRMVPDSESGFVTTGYRGFESYSSASVMRGYEAYCSRVAPAQIDKWVDSNYDLVVLTIGGNDGNFNNIALHCLVGAESAGRWAGAISVLPGLNSAYPVLKIAEWKFDKYCKEDLDNTERALPTIESKVQAVIQNIDRKLNPDSRTGRKGQILLADYPYLINNRDYTRNSNNFGAQLYRIQDAARNNYQRIINTLQAPVGPGCDAKKLVFASGVKQRFAGNVFNAPVGWAGFVGHGNFLHPVETNDNVSKHEAHLTDESFHPTALGYDQGYGIAAYDALLKAGLPGECTRGPNQAGPPAGVPNTGSLLAADLHQSCVVSSDGTLSCWGNGWMMPRAVSSEGTVVAVSLGEQHLCVLLQGGVVGCSGNNLWGQLGYNTPGTQSIILASPWGLSNVSAISAGDYHSCAVLGDGSVTCWGTTRWNPVEVHRTPDLVAGLSNVTAISAGYRRSCALLGDGSVKCWGENGSGQLGDGTTTDRWAPVLVAGLSNVTAISAGYGHSCALLGDGSVKCWGENVSFQLGDGTTTNRSTPVNVVGLGPPVDTPATGSTPPGPVQGLSAIRVFGNQAAVSWKSPGYPGSQPIDYYEVEAQYFSGVGGGVVSSDWTPAGTSSATGSVLRLCPPGIGCAFRVRAHNPSGFGTWVEATTTSV